VSVASAVGLAGAFRRFGLVGLLATFACGGAALFWIVQRLAM